MIDICRNILTWAEMEPWQIELTLYTKNTAVMILELLKRISSQACNLWQRLELGFAMEPADDNITRYQEFVICLHNRISKDLHISEKHGCVETGSSSNGGGAWPYTISQLISSKSEDANRQNNTWGKKLYTYQYNYSTSNCC